MEREIKQLSMKIARGIARAVKKLQFGGINLGRKIGIGADGTATEYIDKIAEDIAIKYVRKSKVAVNILSEEAGFLDFGGEYTLIIDPIDGTRNAVRGIPFYATSIAVGKDTLNSVEYGIVMNIPTGDTYIAEKGEGVYLNNRR
ncbi:MAG: sugar kinase, partial [Thermoplasmata archaeon]|nr:sugar kinase [Thermoplasmata archaeon]